MRHARLDFAEEWMDAHAFADTLRYLLNEGSSAVSIHPFPPCGGRWGWGFSWLPNAQTTPIISRLMSKIVVSGFPEIRGKESP